MVIIPKGVGWYTCIGLVEVEWKVCALIMNNRLRSTITLLDALQGNRKMRGEGTTTTEANLAHNLAGLCHEPLFQIFLDIQKSYDSLDKVK